MANGNSSSGGNADHRNAGGNGGDAKSGGKVKPEEIGKRADAGAGTGAGGGTPAGAGAPGGTDAGAPKPGPGNNAAVNPTALAPDAFERDGAGNVLYKADGVTPRRKRGRKAGSLSGAVKTAPKSTPAKTDAARAAVATEMLAAQFQILNTGIAFLTKFDDFKLDDSEAVQMAEATANVMAQFDYVPDPKVAAVLGLVTTTSMIYGPRLYLYQKSKVAIKAARREAAISEADERVAAGTAGGNGGYPGGPMNMGQFSG